MKNLLKIVTNCIDKFADKAKMRRLAAIIGGAVMTLNLPDPYALTSEMVHKWKLPCFSRC